MGIPRDSFKVVKPHDKTFDQILRNYSVEVVGFTNIKDFARDHRDVVTVKKINNNVWDWKKCKYMVILKRPCKKICDSTRHSIYQMI